MVGTCLKYCTNKVNAWKLLSTASLVIMLMGCICSAGYTENDLLDGLKQDEDRLYTSFTHESVLSKKPDVIEGDENKNTPRQMNIDLSDKFRFRQNERLPSGVVNEIDIKVSDQPTGYSIIVPNVKNLGFPKKAYLKMDLDNGEPGQLILDYGKFAKTVIFPELIGGHASIFLDSNTMIASISIIIEKSLIHQGRIEEHKIAYKRKIDEIMAYENQDSFAKKYILPKNNRN